MRKPINMEKMAAEEEAASATQARRTPQPPKLLKLPLPPTLPTRKTKKDETNKAEINQEKLVKMKGTDESTYHQQYSKDAVVDMEEMCENAKEEEASKE